MASSCAVGSLEEAKRNIRHALEPHLPGGILPDHLGRLLNVTCGLPEQGGTVGPLPDGSLIEVRYVEWNQLRALAGLRVIGTMDEDTDRQAIGSYNAVQA